MCGLDTETSPWNLLHFLGVGITSFTLSIRVFMGGEQLVMEAVMILLCVVPLLFVQLKLGGLVQSSLYGLLNTYFPFLRGVAVTILIQLLLLALYFVILPVYGICLGFDLATSDWAPILSCANHWNTDKCMDPYAQQTYNSSFVDSNSAYQYGSEHPVDEYLENSFFQVTDSLDEMGGFAGDVPIFPLALVATWAFIFLIVGFGPRVFGWVASVLGLSSIVVSLGVLGYGWHKYGKTAHTALLYYYLPNFQAATQTQNWLEASLKVSWLSMLWYGTLPTMGKFTGSGRITRNVTWVFVLFEIAILRHLPVLSIAPYQWMAAKSEDVSFQEVTSPSLTMKLLASILIKSGAPHAVTFFVFFGRYLQQICAVGMFVVAVIDNCMEIFDWVLVKHQWKRRTVWFITAAVFCTVLLLCGIPFTMQGGLNVMVLLDLSVYKLGFVSAYFLTLGFLGTYLWQNVAAVEKVIISTWCIVSAVISVAVGVYFLGHNNWLFSWTGKEIITSSVDWNDISLVIAGVPLVFIFIFMVGHTIQFVIQRRWSGEALIEQPPPYAEAVEVGETPLQTSDKPAENVELISSF